MGQWSSFQVEVPGKWVLCGEHSVLRGVTAIAFPHPEFSLRLEFQAGTSALHIHAPAGPVRELLESALRSLRGSGRVVEEPLGELHIESSIPVGAGLGSSAALCVAVTKWLTDSHRLSFEQQFEFARELENRFHGRSSGMDVAVVMAAAPVAFTMGRPAEVLSFKSLPRFTFHDTGLRARTSECTAQAGEGDELMRQAAVLARDGLENEVLDRVKQAMDLAHRAFEGWGLVPSEAQELRKKLLAQGALSARLTGSGRGGFVVALWSALG